MVVAFTTARFVSTLPNYDKNTDFVSGRKIILQETVDGTVSSSLDSLSSYKVVQTNHALNLQTTIVRNSVFLKNNEVSSFDLVLKSSCSSNFIHASSNYYLTSCANGIFLICASYLNSSFQDQSKLNSTCRSSISFDNKKTIIIILRAL